MSIVLILIAIISLFCLVICATEHDRAFGHGESFNNYYIRYPGRPFLGILNSTIRLTHDCRARPMMEEHFPEHIDFLKHREAIKAEALHVFNTLRLPSFDQVDESFKSIADNRWKTFLMLWYGDMLQNCQHAPITSSLIKKYRHKIACAMFSILEPGVCIPPHNGPSAAALRYHLCLQIPRHGTAKIRVAEEWITYQEGVDYLFDDTFEHEVKIDAPKNDCVRIVLFLDILRSMKPPISTLVHKISQNATFATFVQNINKNGEVQQSIS